MRVGGIVVFILASLASAPQAHAQSAALECARVENDAQRLECYDGLFLATPGDDAALVIESEQLVPAEPTGRAPATMTLACNDGELELRFRFAGTLITATGSNTGVSFKRDLRMDRTLTLPPSDDGRELLIRPTSEVEVFLAWLRGANYLTVQVTPADYRSLSVRFRITDIATRAASTLAACR